MQLSYHLFLYSQYRLRFCLPLFFCCQSKIQNIDYIFKKAKLIQINNLYISRRMSKRSEFNIGQTQKTSVKVHHQPGGQSNWSLGWGEEEKPKPSIQIQKYHNQSNIVLGGKNEQDDEQEKKRLEEQKKKKEEELNKKLPNYDPKSGGKSSLHFGDEKPDYRRKDEVHTSVKVHNPPGGRSNIQFG